MSNVDLLGFDDDSRPTRCNAFAYMHWRDTLKRKCPLCGCEEIFFWTDGSAGLLCAEQDCEWVWMKGEETMQEIEEVFGEKMRKDHAPAVHPHTPEVRPRSFESELDDVFDG